MTFCFHLDEFLRITLLSRREQVWSWKILKVKGAKMGMCGGHSYPLQYSCLENLMDRGIWSIVSHRVGHNWSNLACVQMKLHIISEEILNNSPHPTINVLFKVDNSADPNPLINGLSPSLVAQMVKHLPAITGDLGLIPGLGRSPGEGNGNPLQHSCLENPMDKGAW